MDNPAKLMDIVEALDIQNDDIFYYLHRPSGEIVMVSREEMSAAEEGDDLEDYPDWQQELIKTAIAILEDKVGDYLALPTQFDVHEYQIMEAFCLDIANPRISNEMLYAIKGRGAFRRFKNGLYRHNLEQQWYAYKEEAFKKIAVDWCRKNNVRYV